MYLTGTGVPQDSPQAAIWFRKAAQQGDAYSEASLGDQYAIGDGVPKDVEQAVIWRKRAAEHGNESAQYALE